MTTINLLLKQFAMKQFYLISNWVMNHFAVNFNHIKKIITEINSVIIKFF